MKSSSRIEEDKMDVPSRVLGFSGAILGVVISTLRKYKNTIYSISSTKAIASAKAWR